MNRWPSAAGWRRGFARSCHRSFRSRCPRTPNGKRPRAAGGNCRRKPASANSWRAFRCQRRSQASAIQSPSASIRGAMRSTRTSRTAPSLASARRVQPAASLVGSARAARWISAGMFGNGLVMAKEALGWFAAARSPSARSACVARVAADATRTPAAGASGFGWWRPHSLLNAETLNSEALVFCPLFLWEGR